MFKVWHANQDCTRESRLSEYVWGEYFIEKLEFDLWMFLLKSWFCCECSPQNLFIENYSYTENLVFVLSKCVVISCKMILLHANDNRWMLILWGRFVPKRFVLMHCILLNVIYMMHWVVICGIVIRFVLFIWNVSLEYCLDM